MPLLNSIFGGCSSVDNHKEDVEHRLNKLEIQFDIMERDSTNNIKRLEDKMTMKFDILSGKLDNILMIMNTKK